MVHSVLDRRRGSDAGRVGFSRAIFENALPEDCHEAPSASYPSFALVAGSHTIKHNAAAL